ncbi:MAG TPA: membrane dipeptidase [Thermoanaerobaculia bacterium]|nr:membrane dipeptidase [Thermoanaerobaculia bacterium]
MGFHEDCLVVDGHTDVPTRLWEAPADLGRRLADRHVDLPRARQGGVDALVFALYVPASLAPAAGWQHALEIHQRSLAALPAGMEAVTSVSELRRAVARGAVAVLFGLENGRPLLLPGTLDELAARGVRYVTLTHMRSHEWCDASTDQPLHGGLSSEGERLVREMNRHGILPDVSHVSDDAVRHVVEVSAVPVVASHSSARALCDQPRNLSDELVREIARRGGVVMANSYPSFIGPAAAQADRRRIELVLPELEAGEEEYLRDPAAHWQQRLELLTSHPLPPVPLAAYVDHFVHLIEQAGEEHVGIGTDFDGIPETLEGFEDVSRFPDLTAALLERGVDRAGARLILGENFLRLLALAERHAG